MILRAGEKLPGKHTKSKVMEGKIENYLVKNDENINDNRVSISFLRKNVINFKKTIAKRGYFFI